MRVLVQWALRTPGDWEEIDPHANPQAWANLPKRARPSGIQNLNPQRGWVNAVNVQGIIAEADVYAVEPLVIDGEEAVRLYHIIDQSEPGREQAAVWTIRPLAPDPAHGGLLNTRQSVELYLSPALYAETEAVWQQFGKPHNAALRQWSAFVMPPESLRRYGVQMTDADFAAHRNRRGNRDWREWR